MTVRLDPRPAAELKYLAGKLSKVQLVTRRLIEAALRDAGVGDEPETELLLQALKHGLVGDLVQIKRTKLTPSDVTRLQQALLSRLRVGSPEAAAYAVAAWAAALGKSAPSPSAKPARGNSRRVRRLFGLIIAVMAVAGILRFAEQQAARRVLRDRRAETEAARIAEIRERESAATSAAAPQRPTAPRAASTPTRRLAPETRVRPTTDPVAGSANESRQPSQARAAAPSPSQAPAAEPQRPAQERVPTLRTRTLEPPPAAAAQCPPQPAPPPVEPPHRRFREFAYDLDASPDWEVLAKYRSDLMRSNYGIAPRPQGDLLFIAKNNVLSYDASLGKYRCIAVSEAGQWFRKAEICVFPSCVGIATHSNGQDFQLVYYYPLQDIRIVRVISGSVHDERVRLARSTYAFDAISEATGGWYATRRRTPLASTPLSGFGDIGDRQQLLRRLYDADLANDVVRNLPIQRSGPLEGFAAE